MKIKIFYGWYMVVAGMLLMALNSSIVSYGWTAFIGPITATFGWSMSDIAWASAMRSLEIGVFNPMWGPVVDKGNPKKLMVLGASLSAAGLFCLSQTRNLFMYYAGFLVLGIGSSLAIGMLPQTIMSRWFRKDMGKANGLFFVGAGLGGVAVPLVVWLIDRLGWQNTLLFTSIAMLMLGISISFIFRSRPEDYGMVPDGREDNAAARKKRANSDFGTTVREALRMRAFWHLAVTTLFQSCAMATVIMYAIPYLTGPGIGMDRTTAGTVVGIYTFVSLFGRVIMGSLCDFFRKSWVLAAAIAVQTIGLVLYWQMSGTSQLWYIVLFAIPYGFGVSGVAPLRAPVTAEYFGTKNFASIFGLTSFLFGVGNLIAPPIAGWLFDTYHDYRTWWLILVGMGVVALIAAITMPQPQRQREPAKAAAVSTAK
jgi:MFS transporter, OFA family, oxalate/formate antiporter